MDHESNRIDSTPCKENLSFNGTVVQEKKENSFPY
jgi:hypothetical protein